ncbi:MULTISPECIES: MFS transporter [unclassified Sphingopyxis]|uniref:MFS transporter n=1 Tax=unclassified Sphingopyxis TaxID=2614943 RepID=UPI00072FAB96|nr:MULTISPECIES: MFS transporter [unclassified Sphingopyxis]KTE27091.1 MFS transporter [Sphingopyxis sp. H057]KTE54397.1 MFS transporter [Sphingopyxis sp. H073]KTE56719.1 MFS transporter [Sphingopyxis sp. H071]KTE57864.1 MFS transporter [Sphingopyxis sp. H107]KTE68160.1 MFS transporter [Sphingopyxis sp. H100]
MTPARTIPFIVVTIFIDAIGFGIIMPVLPQLVMEVGKIDLPHAIEIGAWIGLVMAVATFLASPVLGNLSDRFGRRRVLLLSLGGLAADYTLLTVVGTLPWLFVARAISGIFGGSYAAAQAAIADITKPEDRARNFGFVGAAFGVGFVVGPAIGGLLGEMSPRAPFVAAAGLAAANMLYGLIIFPETLPPERRRVFDWRRANPLGALKTMRGLPGMGGIATVLVLWQIASLVYPMTWSFCCIAQLGWTSGMIGASLAAVGVAIAIGQAFVVGPAVARFGERDAATLGILIAVAVYIGYAFTTSTLGAFLLLIPVALQAPVQPSLMAMMSRRATPETQGEVQGISAMAMGLGQLAAPALLTGTMAHFTGDDAPVHFPGAAFVVAAIFGILAIVMLRRLPRAQPADQIPPSVTA